MLFKDFLELLKCLEGESNLKKTRLQCCNCPLFLSGTVMHPFCCNSTLQSIGTAPSLINPKLKPPVTQVQKIESNQKSINMLSERLKKNPSELPCQGACFKIQNSTIHQCLISRSSTTISYH